MAREFVLLRISAPFESPINLMKKAMHKTILQDRWRDVASLTLIPAVVKKASELWDENVMGPSATAPVGGPTVIQIEVEKPVDYRELLAKLDGPTIAALAFAKLDGVMNTLSLARVDAPKLPNAPKREISILEAASPKPVRPRVAVVTHANQFNDIRAKVAALEDRLDVRYIDGDKGTSGLFSVEYAIVTSANSHKVTERAQSAMPKDRVFFVEGITNLVQKLYDIAARQGKARV